VALEVGGLRWDALAEGRRGRPCLQVGRRCPQRGRRWRLLVPRCRRHGQACPPRGPTCRTCSVPQGCPVAAWAAWAGPRYQTSSGRASDRCSGRIPPAPRCQMQAPGRGLQLQRPISGHVPGSARSAHRVRHPPLAWQGVPVEPVSPGLALESEQRGLRRLPCRVVQVLALASVPGQARPAGRAADSRRSRRQCRVRSAGLVVVDQVPPRCPARSATGLASPRRSRRFRVRTSPAPARAAGWPAATGPDGPASAT